MTGPPRRCGITDCPGRAVGWCVESETYLCHLCAASASCAGLLVLAYREEGA